MIIFRTHAFDHLVNEAKKGCIVFDHDGLRKEKSRLWIKRIRQIRRMSSDGRRLYADKVKKMQMKLKKLSVAIVRHTKDISILEEIDFNGDITLDTVSDKNKSNCLKQLATNFCFITM